MSILAEDTPIHPADHSIDDSPQTAQRRISRRQWLETIAAFILSVTTIMTAWSAYQASRWGGYMSILFNQAGAARTEGARLSDEANTLLTIDVSLFAQYAQAVSTDNSALADFLRQRFRPEMRTALDAWLATDPLRNPDAPSSPFTIPEYNLATARESQRLIALAESRVVEALEANQNSDNYILLTVLFASGLFFAGMSMKFKSDAIKALMLIFGGLIFLAATGTLLTFPIY